MTLDTYSTLSISSTCFSFLEMNLPTNKKGQLKLKVKNIANDVNEYTQQMLDLFDWLGPASTQHPPEINNWKMQ